MSDPASRLKRFLTANGSDDAFHALTADASTREYFRVKRDGRNAVACVYPEPLDEAQQTYLDVTNLFLASGLPVAKIFTHDKDLGVIVQEDLGDTILRDVIDEADATRRGDLIDEAIGLIARIQAATDTAFELDSVASRLRFDTEKLLWELNYFKTNFFATFLKRPLSSVDDERISKEFLELSMELESRSSVLCHRDFHAANLMIDTGGNMRIIDHQDARIGSPAYDLVSLLLDRVTELPTEEWLAARRKNLLEKRAVLGLEEINEGKFDREFKLQTIQRCLKAAGTFSYQSIVRGKTHFIPFIEPMLASAVSAAHSSDQFPAIRDILGREIELTP
ncbi:MAG: phosphotransferase [Pyrinomonadaceae bacterium]